MNRIEMYASSSDLRHGLHRVLAVSYGLTEPLRPGERLAWWSLLPQDLQEDGRTHSLSLEALATVWPVVADTVDRARARLGLEPLDATQVQSAFRAAIISGRAHKAHGGRDVYGISNKHLWDSICAPFGAAVTERWGPRPGDGPVRRGPAPESALRTLEQLTAFDTSPAGEGHDACVEWLSGRLQGLGFSLEVLGHELGRPLIHATREARGLRGHVVLYGHYDVTPFGRSERWTHPPRQLTRQDGRLFARGVADNKGPLACRLDALARLDRTPQLTWILQGEEETGSKVGHALLPDMLAALRPTLWMDETGYHDAEDGTLRLLGRRIGEDDASLSVDPALEDLLRGLGALASRWGVASRHELRGLNKNVVEGGCPFNHALPLGARYLAIGVNDSAARIHGLDESLPEWTFPLHAQQLDLVFQWAHRTAG